MIQVVQETPAVEKCKRKESPAAEVTRSNPDTSLFFLQNLVKSLRSHTHAARVPSLFCLGGRACVIITVLSRTSRRYASIGLIRETEEVGACPRHPRLVRMAQLVMHGSDVMSV